MGSVLAASTGVIMRAPGNSFRKATRPSVYKQAELCFVGS